MREILVVLETMWGTHGSAPRWFPINPDNHSGKRLYRMTGMEDWHVWVTNACPQQTGHATQHGKPSPRWLHESLIRLPRHISPWTPLLVCGKVAQATYDEVCENGYEHLGKVLRLRHPAARTWTTEQMQAVRRTITRLYPL